MNERRSGPNTPSPSSTAGGRWRRWLFPLLLVAATLAAFWPCVDFPFVELDDDRNFTQNTAWRGLSAANLEWMWNQYHIGHWHPLTWLSLALDYELWGKGPGGEPLAAPLHRTNLALHALGALAFYFLALELLRWTAGFVSARPDAPQPTCDQSLLLRACALLAALTWSLHPLRVESVAWVTERRDVLSGVFLTSCVLVYLRAARHGASWAWLAPSLALYCASLLSKAWGITLPVILLALDVWILKRPATSTRGGASWNRLLAEKLAFGALALWVALRAKEAQAQIGAVMTFEEHTLLERCAQAAYGLCFYVVKSLWPSGLSAHYLLEVEFRWDEPIHLAALAVVALVTGSLLFFVRRRPEWFATWFCYGVLVSPVLGFLQSGAQKVADRYAYLAAMPFSVALAGAVALACLRRASAERMQAAARAVLIGCAALAALLGVLANQQTRVWRSSESLFRRALEVEPDNYFVGHNLAVILWKESRFPEALEVEKASVAAHPGYGNHLARYTLGLLHQRLGQNELAEQAFRETVLIAPDNEGALNNLRSILQARGDQAGLLALYEQAAQSAERNRREDARRPVVMSVFAELARLYAARGDFERAKATWERARDHGVHASLTENAIGKLYLARGDLAEAQTRLVRAQQYDLRNPDLVLDLCDLFLRQGQVQDAATNAERVLAANPNNARARALLQQAQARGAAR